MLDLPPVDIAIIQQECARDFSSYIERYKGIKPQKIQVKDDDSRATIENKRKLAILKEALIVGALAGKKRRAEQINMILSSPEARDILNSFSFKPLMYQSNIVPPVITEVGASVSINDGGKSATTTRKSWRIIQPAYIRTGALTWENYLLGDKSGYYQRGIFQFYAPKDANDVAFWKKSYCEGYKEGFNTANATFMSNLSKFKRDYLGMLRFKRLQEEGVVSAPKVVKTNLGIVVDDKWTQIDKKDVRIVVESSFQPQKQWDNSFVHPEK